MHTQKRKSALRRYFSARFTDIGVQMASSLPSQQVADAIASGVRPIGLRSAFRSAFGLTEVSGWVHNDRFLLHAGGGRGSGATLTGRLYEAADGSTVVMGRLRGLQPMGIGITFIWLFSGIFIYLFGWAAIDPSVSTPPVPRWAFLVPIAIDMLGLFIIEVH